MVIHDKYSHRRCGWIWREGTYRATSTAKEFGQAGKGAVDLFEFGHGQFSHAKTGFFQDAPRFGAAVVDEEPVSRGNAISAEAFKGRGFNEAARNVSKMIRNLLAYGKDRTFRPGQEPMVGHFALQVEEMAGNWDESTIIAVLVFCD